MMLAILHIHSTKDQVTLLRAMGAADVRLCFLWSASIQWKIPLPVTACWHSQETMGDYFM